MVQLKVLMPFSSSSLFTAGLEKRATHQTSLSSAIASAAGLNACPVAPVRRIFLSVSTSLPPLLSVDPRRDPHGVAPLTFMANLAQGGQTVYSGPKAVQ